MARNGSGTYSLPAGNPVTTGTTISSTWANNTLSDIATALTSSIAKDGQTTPTANLPLGGFKITGMGVGSANTDSLTLGQAQNQGYLLIGSVSGTNTITGSLSPAITAYVAGQKFCFVSAGANTGAVTLNINSVGAKSITKLGTTALASGDIPANAIVCVAYDGTQFQLIGIASQVAKNLTGGGAGQLPYQSASDTTAFLAAGTSGQVLTSGGTGAPTWGSKVANLTGGGAGQIPYQSAADTTAFLAAGTSGYLLQSNGTSAPSWAQTTFLGNSSQTWQDVTASRVSGNTYTNNTGATIFVHVMVNTSGGGSYAINGNSFTLSTINQQVVVAFPIPNGNTYSVSGSITKWLEMR